MATWEDGPEYAPRERPQYFADAAMPPLERADPFVQPSANAPVARPQFEGPQARVAPLAALVPVPADERDPSTPFDVVSSNLTSEPSWAGVGLTPTTPLASTPTAPTPTAPIWPTGTPVPTATAPTPTNNPWPVLDQPPTSPQPDPYAFPAPGTPGWFAPPPAMYGERPPGRIGAKEVVEAATPGLCIVLALGGIIYPLAPIMLVVAIVLSTRVQVARPTVRIAARSAAGALVLFAVIAIARSELAGTGWWDFLGGWSVLFCWALLVVVLVAVWRALIRPAQPPQDAQQPPWH